MTAANGDLEGPREVRLRELRGGLGSAVVVARVVRSERREVVRRSDGQRRPVLSGLLSDGTATLPFTWWDPPDEPVDAGSVVRIARPELREFRGRIEISITWKSRVEPASPLELAPVEPHELPRVEVGQLSPGSEGFCLEARVTRCAEKRVRVAGEDRTIHEGTLEDGSGAIAFTAWNEFGFAPGSAVRILGGFVRVFRGRPEISLDDRTRIEGIEGSDLPPASTTLVAARPERPPETLTFEGVVVGLSPPSGLVVRCPQCSRTVVSGSCRVHGAVTGGVDLQARIVLDDGTDTVTVQADRARTEALWDTSLAVVLGRTSPPTDPPTIEAELTAALFGRRLRATGRTRQDDFGVTMYPDRIDPVVPALPARLAEVKARLRRTPS